MTAESTAGGLAVGFPALVHETVVIIDGQTQDAGARDKVFDDPSIVRVTRECQGLPQLSLHVLSHSPSQVREYVPR